jgi:two-component system, NarL family, nitrate/nitrite response regulator NarL
MRTPTTTTTRASSRMGERVGIAGPHRWSRELLIAAIAKRLRAPTVDLGTLDVNLAARVSRERVRLLVAEIWNTNDSRMLERIRGVCLQSRVVLLTATVPDGELVSLVRKGIAGVALPDVALAELVSDLKQLWQGKTVCTPLMTRLLLRHIAGGRRSAAGAPFGEFSPRELEIASLVKKGLPNKLIADQLGISQGTVKNHIHRMLQKFAFRNRSDIARACPSAFPEFGV